MAKKPSTSRKKGPRTGSRRSSAKKKASAAKKPSPLDEKQEMVEKFFRHTNDFLEQNKADPLLVVEAMAAILVRYAALLGPVEQLKDRLDVLENLIGQESAQIQKIAAKREKAK